VSSFTVPDILSCFNCVLLLSLLMYSYGRKLWVSFVIIRLFKILVIVTCCSSYILNLLIPVRGWAPYTFQGHCGLYNILSQLSITILFSLATMVSSLQSLSDTNALSFALKNSFHSTEFTLLCQAESYVVFRVLYHFLQNITNVSHPDF
jgi:hypothetical protein